jgi:hypothetical protein
VSDCFSICLNAQDSSGLHRPTMVPFIEPDMVAQHHRHIVAYAELLAQWGLHYKSTEVRRSIPNLQNSKIEAAVESRDGDKILSVERLCTTCASTSDGLKPFGTCTYNHNWSSSMKCTVCRLPARGKHYCAHCDLPAQVSSRAHETVLTVHACCPHGMLEEGVYSHQIVPFRVWVPV